MTGVHIEACPACGSLRIEPFISSPDRQFDKPGVFQYDACAECGLAFINPMPDGATLAEHYPDEYYPLDPEALRDDPMNVSWQTEKVDIVERYSNGRGRILDVGTGTRGLLTFFRDRGWDTVGVEFGARAAEFAGKTWNLDVRSGSIEEQRFDDASFDAVTFFHVIEHLTDPFAALLESARILKPGGLLVVAAPNIASLQARLFGSRWFHLDAPRHVYQFSPASATAMAKRTGFKTVDVVYSSREQNWAGWHYSIVPFNPARRKKFPRLLRKLSEKISPLLARIEEALGMGGTFTLVAKRPSR